MTISVIIAALGLLVAEFLGEPFTLIFAIPLVLALGAKVDELEDRIYSLEEIIYDSCNKNRC
jgi:hypothetical protein